jgi:DNA-binding NarL/FixJ family response regulator
MSDTPRIRVFIVDDHPLVREWLGNLLRLEADIEVCGEAEEPTSAISAMLSLNPAVAIVDLSLKRGSGLELIKELRATLPGIRVLVLSMHEEISDVERSMRAGALGYVMKSDSTGQIVSAIREVNAGRVYANADTLARLAGRIIGRVPHDPATASEALSDREFDVFRRLGEGHSTRRISEDLGVSQKTIQTYCARIKEKLGFSDGSELMQAAIRWSQSKRS